MLHHDFLLPILNREDFLTSISELGIKRMWRSAEIEKIFLKLSFLLLFYLSFS